MYDKKIDSHKYIPKVILKHFQNKNGQIFLYDFKNKKIIRTNCNDINVEYGFYSLEMEEYLNKDIEQRLGILIQVIEKEMKKDSLHLYENNTNAIYEYIITVFARSPVTIIFDRESA